MEKMSKSRGNIVWVDEVVFGVSFIDDDFEFRNEAGFVVEDYKKFGVWRDVYDMCGIAKGCYFTSHRCGLQPVFYCRKEHEIPPKLIYLGEEIFQHLQSKWWDEPIKGGYYDVKKGDDVIWSIERELEKETDLIRAECLLRALKAV